MNFTAHNILLDNNERTMGTSQTLMSESAMWTSIESTLDFIFPTATTDRSKLRVVDLGCLEGGYAVEFARLGFDTLGIDARQSNIDNCNYVKSHLSLPHLNFVTDDVRNLEKYGRFDVVLCYGLLYHLDKPVEFLKQISDNTNKLLLLNTHFAAERDIRYDLGFLNNNIIAPIQKRTHFLEFQKNFRLSAVTKNEGYKGRWYKEWNKTTKKSKIEKMLWASYNNDRSFWLCKKELTTAMNDVGFKHVFEQFNFTGDLAPHNYTEFSHRTMFVAVK